jgi:Spa2 Homology Domain (SHD)-containing protein
VESALEEDEEKASKEGDVFVRAKTGEKGQVRHGLGNDVRGCPANAVDPCVWVVGLDRLFYGSSSTRFILAPPLNTMRSTRAPSPTLTSFSGISNYRTESYKPLRDKSAVPTPPVDSYQVARTHYDELSKYLSAYLAKGSIPPYLRLHSLTFIPPPPEPANSRSTARQKLTRLTRQQFQELSTDVYDELIRRKTNSDSILGLSFSLSLRFV